MRTAIVVIAAALVCASCAKLPAKPRMETAVSAEGASVGEYECLEPYGADPNGGTCHYSCLTGLCPKPPGPDAYECLDTHPDGTCGWWCLKGYCNPLVPTLSTAEPIP
jgi:hypothetical protein